MLCTSVDWLNCGAGACGESWSGGLLAVAAIDRRDRLLILPARRFPMGRRPRYAAPQTTSRRAMGSRVALGCSRLALQCEGARWGPGVRGTTPRGM